MPVLLLEQDAATLAQQGCHRGRLCGTPSATSRLMPTGIMMVTPCNWAALVDCCSRELALCNRGELTFVDAKTILDLMRPEPTKSRGSLRTYRDSQEPNEPVLEKRIH
jgi:hypothetical protein